MERKIGEIFEYNGEWYQCVEGVICLECCFSQDGCTCDINGKLNCTRKGRNDDKSVVFKKLEKVGEPFSCNYYGDKRLIMMQEYRAYDNRIIPPNGIPMYVTDEKHKKVAIEIRQNQEDMEEKCDGCKYSDEEIEIMRKAESEVIKVMGGELGIPEKIPYLYSFICGALELGWLDKYKCQSGKLCPFDLEAAKQGKPVCTRDGRKARIICFDRDWDMHIVALVTDPLGESVDKQNDEDLMMLPEKKEGWVNLYRYSTPIYETEEKAISCVGSEKRNEYIDSVKVQWYE